MLLRKHAAELELGQVALDLKAVAEEGEIEGYGSVFGERDSGGDIVQPGAFKSSLTKKGVRGIKMLYQHDMHDPIGVWTEIKEDGKGLFVRGRLLLDDPDGAKAFARIKAGAVDGLSIGYRTVKSRFDRSKDARLLEEVDLWEVSVVTFPMNESSRIQRVKTALQEFDPTTWERAFRDEGLSNREAKLATSVARKMVLRDGGQPEPAPRDAGADALLAAIRSATDALRS